MGRSAVGQLRLAVLFGLALAPTFITLSRRSFPDFDERDGFPRTAYCSTHKFGCREGLLENAFFDRHARRSSEIKRTPCNLDTYRIAYHEDFGMVWPDLFPSERHRLKDCPCHCEAMPFEEAKSKGISIDLILHTRSVRETSMGRGKSPNVKNALVSLEYAFHSEWINRNLPVDVLVSYSKKSDLIINYFYAMGLEDGQSIKSRLMPLEPREFPIKSTAPIGALFISNCDSRVRNRFIRELAASGLILHQFGRCKFGKNVIMMNETDFLQHHLTRPYLPEFTSKENIMREYPFALAFENTISLDYVTEKFFQALTSGSLPVVFGAPNLYEYSFSTPGWIDASQFSSGAELGLRLLELMQDPAAYLSYFRWRDSPRDLHQLSLLGRFNFGTPSGPESVLCRLCSFMRTRHCLETHPDQPA